MVNFERKSWPAADLEAVSQCPVCGEARRSLLHNGLVDRVFGVADGVWCLYRCARCESAYLDPRPTPESMGRAYAGYYTHDSEDHPIVSCRGWLRRLAHDLINGYQNSRYRLHRQSALPAGRWLLPLLPSLCSAANAECRHLPALPVDGGRLLDVGCGNGGFLALAKQGGWQVEGVDFDADAVKTARARGLNVRHGGIEILVDCEASFDVITICHVIEHVYDPVGTLRQLHALLKPGGMLWLETPNLASLGSRRFGSDWRGLEPPRHLVLFNPSSLRQALATAGFHSLRQRWRGLSLFDVFASSEAMALGSTSIGVSCRGRSPLRGVVAEACEMLRPERREFLTFLARK